MLSEEEAMTTVLAVYQHESGRCAACFACVVVCPKEVRAAVSESADLVQAHVGWPL